mgnify:CR=1 FL=1|tara:strand:- start:2092 stop:2595 length:504 start_codon:yes stop_codon:yes gene_type:complete
MHIEEARKFAHEQLSKYNLTGWKFSFNRSLTYAGICYGSPANEIRISKPICEVESAEFIKDTILHEIAHAIVGTHHMHDIVWQECAKRIGCSPDATYEESEAIIKAKLAKTKYVMCFGDKIVKLYLRKPNQKTFSTIKNYWVKGDKEQSQGKLKLVAYNPSVHLEFA